MLWWIRRIPRRQKYSFPVSTDGGALWAWAWRIIALAGYVAILKEMHGPQEWWKCALLTCLPVQSWAGHRQPGQQVAEGLADPTTRINHSSKSRGQKSPFGKQSLKNTEVCVGQALPNVVRQWQEQLALRRLTSLQSSEISQIITCKSHTCPPPPYFIT